MESNFKGRFVKWSQPFGVRLEQLGGHGFNLLERQQRTRQWIERHRVKHVFDVAG